MMNIYINGIFLVIFTFSGFAVYAHDNLYKFDALNEFKSHSLIQPQIHHGKHKNVLKTTLEESQDGLLHTSHITLKYSNDGENIIADLYLNEDLIPEGHFLRYQNSKTGRDIIQNFTKTEIELCHYQGKIRGKSESRVAVSTCHDGINGIVFDGINTYFIHSGPNGAIHRDHYLLRHTDMIKNATCGYHDHDDNSKTNKIINHDDGGGDDGDGGNILSNIDETNILQNTNINRMLRYKRSTTEIRGPYNANKYSSFVELVLVVDNKVFQSFGENMKKIHNHCKDVANIVNALYVPLNIYIALVGVVVWNESDEILLSEDGDITLKNFLQYRRTKLVVSHPNDNAQLLTKVQFSGGVVGKALKGPICTFEYSGGVSMEHSSIVGVVATTVAHEMGHNFGMEHDTMDCKCEDEKCIMSASSTSVVPRHWSSCSKDQLNVAFSRGMNYCLRNKPVKLFDSPQCGNGFVEVGEQCDCGLPKYCQNTCCDPTTCMLYANASCATGECCDLTTCRPKAPGIQCRSAQGECDLPEFCTGEAEYCPTDVFKRDTIKCDNGDAYCYQGNCRSRTAQCKVLWGPSGQSSEYCYEKNIDGNRHGNCGFDRYNIQYMKCNESDVYCGMLHCRHLNERLEFGMESVAVLSHTFMNHKSNIIPCRTAIVDLGLESTDPGLTPNGAKCGNDKMCVNQKCVDVKQFRAIGKSVDCPENCNDNGVCNSKGNCHCFVGFAPPYCNSPGPGGSYDSGPETNPNHRVGFTRAMYIFFLGVVPCVSIFLFLMYYYKQIKSTGSRKSSIVLKPAVKTSPPRGGPGNSPSGGMPTSSPSSTDDMNSALLRSPAETDTSVMNNSMFGKFKGFTLRPLPNATVTTPGTEKPKLEGPKVAFVHPVSKPTLNSIDTSTGVPMRSAPSAPKTSEGIALENDIKKILQNGTLQHLKKTPPNTLGKNLIKNNGAPALPPPNPGFHARPLISNPVLETSTCTAKEIVVSPTTKSEQVSFPVRPAPTAPPVPPHADPSKFFARKDGTIKRIASFLNKKDEKVSNHPPKIKPSIDRARLKTIEISGPIPFVNDSMEANNQTDRSSINRTQSMRSPSKKNSDISADAIGTSAQRTNLQSFGSMRQQSGVNRPKSIVNNTARPKSPPPPRPPAPPTNYKVPGQPRKYVENQYDDCEAVEIPLTSGNADLCSNGDEIYSVIDERPPPPPVPSITTKIPLDNNQVAVNTTATTEDGMGLLGEIVNEIEKRNGDSIYSASTLRKKKSIDSSNSSTRYENTTDINSSDMGDVDYLRSNSSTSSGGYLRPSAINTPIARVAPTRPDFSPAVKLPNSQITTTAHSFSSFKPGITQQQKSANVTSSKTPSSPVESKKVPVIGRTKTPPSLSTSNSIRKRSPSPVNSTSTTLKTTIPNNGGKNATIHKNKPFISPKMIRKSSQSDSKSFEQPVTATIGAKKSFSALSQKPKPLSKPIVPTSGAVIPPGNKFISNIGRQNSNPSTSTSSSDPKLRSTQLLPNRKPNVKADDNQTGNIVSDNTNSRNLNAAARPLPGKVSAVASLQQKFENNSSNGTNKTNNGSSLNGVAGKRN